MYSTLSIREQLHQYTEYFKTFHVCEQDEIGMLSYSIYDYLHLRHNYVASSLENRRLVLDPLVLTGVPSWLREVICDLINQANTHRVSESQVKKFVFASCRSTVLG